MVPYSESVTFFGIKQLGWPGKKSNLKIGVFGTLVPKIHYFIYLNSALMKSRPTSMILKADVESFTKSKIEIDSVIRFISRKSRYLVLI